MEVSVLQPVFQNVLKLMSRIKTKEELDDLKNAISEYYARRADEEIDKLWEKGIINEDVVQGWANAHYRTPYKH